MLDIVATKGESRCYPLPGKLSHIRTLLVWRPNYESSKLDALRALLPKRKDGKSGN